MLFVRGEAKSWEYWEKKWRRGRREGGRKDIEEEQRSKWEGVNEVKEKKGGVNEEMKKEERRSK